MMVPTAPVVYAPLPVTSRLALLCSVRLEALVVMLPLLVMVPLLAFNVTTLLDDRVVAASKVRFWLVLVTTPPVRFKVPAVTDPDVPPRDNCKVPVLPELDLRLIAPPEDANVAATLPLSPAEPNIMSGVCMVAAAPF